jgi:uncharacterized protein
MLVALGAMFLTAQTPAAIPPWCNAIPLPSHASFGVVKSDVDGRPLNTKDDTQCRPLQVRAPHATLRLAVAATDTQRERGLMGVPFVPAGQGMIFVFPDTGDQLRAFWMKNTITPLDMVFVKLDGSISSIAANVPATAPGTPDDRVARREGTGRYVIELGAGEAARVGLTPGTRITVPPISAQ